MGRNRWHFVLLIFLIFLLIASLGESRQREPNESYAARRQALRARVDGPVVLFGYTGREDASPSYVFQQEENFYYLTGHNEEGAALLLVPEPPAGRRWDGPQEILFLPPRNTTAERWNGPRLAAEDPDAVARTGVAAVRPFAELEGELKRLAAVFPRFYTLLPRENEAGYPHTRIWQDWLKTRLRNAHLADLRATLGAMRQVKMPTELRRLEKAIEVSIDAHLAAMHMLRPGLYEYQVAARMEYVHKLAGCERTGYAPIVGTGFNSTVLHYNQLGRRIETGDIVVLDVGAQCDGYVADITRTLPADGTFSPRQREIYEIVLGAQNAALAALKPGMRLSRSGPNSLHQIAYDYINSHGTDRQGRTLGRYFIHGLGHHIGLNVHDAGDPSRPLEPGMVVTIEPGIYIPEENLGVRIEDIVLITEDGYQLLTARLPRTAEAIEQEMARPQADPACTPNEIVACLRTPAPASIIVVLPRAPLAGTSLPSGNSSGRLLRSEPRSEP
ncbi:MAG: Xaa-Pro peptidase family protein [Firmicutes bacterium]|nr:Xaa-Pro peptidase family protein [Bacillota bacterium]